MNLAFILKPKSQVATVYADSTFRQGLEKLRHHGYTAVPVISRDNKYLGTLSEGDLLWSIVDVGGATLSECEELRISDVLRPDKYPPAHITDSIDSLIMQSLNRNFIPVVDDRGMFMGIVTRQGIISYFLNHP